MFANLGDVGEYHTVLSAAWRRRRRSVSVAM